MFPILDILVAAHFAAWYMSFTTEAKASRSLDNMLAQTTRVRVGILACGMSMMVVMASLILRLVGAGDLQMVVNLLAYPPSLFGTIALASATWNVRPKISSGGGSDGVVA